MLRHLLGLLAGLVITPLLWAGAAWSAAVITEHVQAQRFGDPLLLTACAAMMGVGLVCGVLAGSRVSPLAAFLTGGVLLGVSLWPLFDHASLAAVLPDWFADPGALLHPLGPGLPLHLALGTLLFISALPPSRWRSPRRGETDPVPLPPRAPVSDPAAVPLPDQGPVLAPAAEPLGADWADDDPSRTTIPFRRDGDGFPPVEDPADHSKTFGDGR